MRWGEGQGIVPLPAPLPGSIKKSITLDEEHKEGSRKQSNRSSRGRKSMAVMEGESLNLF